MHKLQPFSILESFLFSRTEVDHLKRQFERLVLQDGQVLLCEGHVSDKIYFIETGILREFYKVSDTEVTTWLLDAGNWACNIESYVTQQPSKRSIEAVGKTEVVYIHKSSISDLINDIPALRDFLMLMYESYLLKVDQLNTLFRIRNAEERFLLFEANNQRLVGRVKQKHLASFLGITPSQLSRIRAKNTKK